MAVFMTGVRLPIAASTMAAFRVQFPASPEINSWISIHCFSIYFKLKQFATIPSDNSRIISPLETERKLKTNLIYFHT